MVQACDERTQEILGPYPKRWSPYLLKFAVIMQLFYDPTSVEITVQALRSALVFLLPAIKSTIYLFEGPLGESKLQQECDKLFQWISNRMAKTGKPIKRGAVLASKQLNGGYKKYNYIVETITVY